MPAFVGAVVASLQPFAARTKVEPGVALCATAVLVAPGDGGGAGGDDCDLRHRLRPATFENPAIVVSAAGASAESTYAVFAAAVVAVVLVPFVCAWLPDVVAGFGVWYQQHHHRHLIDVLLFAVFGCPNCPAFAATAPGAGGAHFAGSFFVSADIHGNDTRRRRSMLVPASGRAEQQRQQSHDVQLVRVEGQKKQFHSSNCVRQKIVFLFFR